MHLLNMILRNLVLVIADFVDFCRHLLLHSTIVDGQTDPFAFIRRFADEWNIQMLRCVTPGCILVVDESMGQWLGKGMPGLMHVLLEDLPQMEEKGILFLTVKLGVYNSI